MNSKNLNLCYTCNTKKDLIRLSNLNIKLISFFSEINFSTNNIVSKK